MKKEDGSYKEYALYKGDEIIAIGTAKEIAKEINVSLKTLYFYKSPTYLKRRSKSKKGNYRVLVEIEEDNQ